MALNTNQNVKLYYSIREVAEMFGVSESLLRYWEQEFPTLRPKTVPGTKVRQYQEKDLKTIRNIYSLVKTQGFKIAAARKKIYKNPNAVDKNGEIISTLVDVRKELYAIKRQLGAMV